MPSRLNSDGAKIKALRLQRGWTQEQLAEIAGVSARTIQRAETAGSAAFDTLRAIAGAFETDFDQLLGNNSRQMPEPEPQSAQVADPIPEPHPKAPLPRPAQPVPRKRALFPIAASSLAAGLLAGGIFVYLFYPLMGLNLSTPPPNPAVTEQVRAGKESRHHDLNAVSTPRILPTVSSTVTVRAIPGRESGRVSGKPGHRRPVPAAEAIQVADLGPYTTIPEPLQSAVFELPLPRNLPPILATAEITGGWNPVLADPGDLTQKDQAAGAVRQSIGQAAKKTSDSIAKVGASLRRVF